MPKSRCPLCGSQTHHNILDQVACAEFEARYPEIWVVGYACRICNECKVSLNVGDPVEFRTGKYLGQVGVIDHIADCQDRGILYRVRIDNGGYLTGARSQIFKISTIAQSVNDREADAAG